MLVLAVERTVDRYATKRPVFPTCYALHTVELLRNIRGVSTQRGAIHGHFVVKMHHQMKHMQASAKNDRVIFVAPAVYQLVSSTPQVVTLYKGRFVVFVSRDNVGKMVWERKIARQFLIVLHEVLSFVHVKARRFLHHDPLIERNCLRNLFEMVGIVGTDRNDIDIA